MNEVQSNSGPAHDPVLPIALGAESKPVTAPGVILDRPQTWLHESTYGPDDYKSGEGLIDWEMARQNPDEPQYLRVYLLEDNPHQPRVDIDIPKRTQIFRSIAIAQRVHDSLEVRPHPKEEHKVRIISGHTRKLGAINAALKLVPCRFVFGSELEEHIRLLTSNTDRSELSDRDVANHLMRIGNLMTQEGYVANGIDHLIETFDKLGLCTPEKAKQLLVVGGSLCDAAQKFMGQFITLEQAAEIAVNIKDPAAQVAEAKRIVEQRNRLLRSVGKSNKSKSTKAKKPKNPTKEKEIKIKTNEGDVVVTYPNTVPPNEVSSLLRQAAEKIDETNDSD